MDQNQPQDPKAVVRSGYDQMADTYLNWTTAIDSPRLKYLEKLLSKLPDSSTARVLELGCGAGVPGTQTLAKQCREVVANDISDAQIKLARVNVPNANVQFIREDMTQLHFDPGSLDAVVAFYSILHLPREEQRGMFQQVFAWLSPGSYLLCNLGAEDNPGSTADWLGSRMYWSSFDAEMNLQQVRDAGFNIVESEILVDNEDGRLAPFLWILAQKS